MGFNSTLKLVQPELKLYKRRWLMLLMFSILGVLSGFQWIEMSIVEDVLVDYYRVDARWIEWTTTIWSLTCVLFAIPGAWMIEIYGLRPVLLTCGFANALGTVLKGFSSDRDQFPCAFIGQAIASVCQAVLLGVPPRLASVWFGEKELSTATSIGILGVQVGVSLGFVIPPFVIQDNEDKTVIKSALEYLNWTLAISSVICLITMFIWLEEEPPAPPSLATMKQKAIPKEDLTFMNTLKELFRNSGFLMLMLVYGTSMGVYCSFSTLLNAFVITYYPNGQKLVGGLGLAVSAPGLVGLVITGLVLDRTKKFKEALIFDVVLNILSTAGFILALHMGSIPFQYVTGASFGFFQAAMWTIGFETATELTYPIAEGTTNGVVTAVSQIFTIVLTVISGHILPSVGVVGCFYLFIGLSVVSAIIAGFIPATYKREEANRNDNSQNERTVEKKDFNKEGIEITNYLSISHM